jgi:hypothetical protein
MARVKDEFLSEEDLDLANLSEAELHEYWDLWLHQAQASNDLDARLYSHGVFLEEPRREASPLSARERQILDFLLDGSGDALAGLREQLANVLAIRRLHSGVGFFLDFDLASTGEPLPGRPSFHIGDAVAEVQELEQGMGFILFVREGIATQLEGYTFDGPLPEDWHLLGLSYVDAFRPTNPPIQRPPDAPRTQGTVFKPPEVPG